MKASCEPNCLDEGSDIQLRSFETLLLDSLVKSAKPTMVAELADEILISMSLASVLTRLQAARIRERRLLLFTQG